MKSKLLISLFMSVTLLCPGIIKASDIATASHDPYNMVYNDNHNEDHNYYHAATTQRNYRGIKKKKGFNAPKTNDYWGVVAGYASKVWSQQTQAANKHNVGVYDSGWLHGIQFGIRFNPMFKYGFGLDTGIYYEYYHNKSSIYEDGINKEGTFNYYKTLNEHVIRVPLHLEYRLNFSKNFQLFFYGGLAADYVISGNMSYTQQGYQSPYEVQKDIYGTIIPSAKRYNASLSFGGGFRFSALQFNVGSQMGLIDVSPSPDYELRQNNPLSVTLSVMF